MADFLQDPARIQSLQGPNPLNNPILGKMLQEKAMQAQQPQPGAMSAPTDAAAQPPTLARVEHTHDIAGMGEPASAPGAAPPPSTLSSAPMPKPLAKINPVEPNAPEIAHQTEYNRLTGAGPDPNQGKPGWQQIHNPVLRTLAGIGNAASTLFPSISMATPGTSMHHQLLVNQEKGALDQEQKNRSQTAQEQLEAAKAEHQINTEDQAAKAGAAPHTIVTAQGIMQYNPDTKRYDIPVGQSPEKPESEGKTITTDQGVMQWNPDTKRYDIQAGGAPGAKTGTVHQLEDGTLIMAHPDGTATPVTVNGQPAKGKTTTGKDSIEEQVINEHLKRVHPGETMAQARQHTQPAPQRDPDVALDRETGRFAKPHEKNVADATSQLEKIADARAMINGGASAQALGIPKVLTALVSGQGSGVRITQAELNSIARARGIGGDVEGFINSVSGQGKLTSTQQKQLTELLDGVKERIEQKQKISGDALDKINSARSREEIIKADADARHALTAPTGGGGGGGETTKEQYDKLPIGATYTKGGQQFVKR